MPDLISKLNVGGSSYNLRDAASMHYLGHTTTDIVPTGETSPTGATITIGGASVTAVANDYVTSGTANLNYIFNGTTWDTLSEAAAEIPVQDVKVNNVSIVTNNIANIPIATNAAVGLVQAGTNIGITDGVISVADATDAVKGVVQLSTAIPSTGAVDTKAATEKAVADAIGAIPVRDVTVNGTSVVDSSDHTAKVVINAATIEIDSETAANNALPDGVTATTQATSDDSTKIATTAYVHDLFDDIANPMIFKGDATLTADSTDPTTAAITVSGTVKKGYTYKITSIATTTPAYSGKLKVGDTLIADKDNPKVTADWVAGTDWTVVPSGDENDGTVMSVSASAASGSNLTVSVADTETGSTSTITEAGSITVGIASGYQLLADADKTKIDTIGSSSAVFNSVTASSTEGTHSAAPAHVGKVGEGEDGETLYIDFLNFGTADVVGEATTP